jgi:hypothetical protein
VLDAALQHFQGEQIFIVDNGNEEKPPTNTQEIVHNRDPQINYMWLPVGSKNAAQFAGSMAASRYDNIMTIDDDVTLPENFFAPTSRINDSVKAVAFPVQGIDHKGKRPLFVAWQDLEYKFSGLSKEAEGATCGVMYPHGAGCFWDRKTLLSVLRLHDLIFIAEDVKMGLGLQAVGKRMAIESGVVLDTEVPETILGAAPNYYQQRVRSWEMGRHLLYWKFLNRLFRRNGQNTVIGFSVQKVSQTYAIASNLVDWLRVPLFVAMGANANFWTLSAAFSAGPVVPLLTYKYIKCSKRSDLAPALSTVLTFPIYKILYATVSILGAVRSVGYWWPSLKPRKTIAQLEKTQDPRAIWLRPDLLDNRRVSDEQNAKPDFFGPVRGLSLAHESGVEIT